MNFVMGIEQGLWQNSEREAVPFSDVKNIFEEIYFED